MFVFISFPSLLAKVISGNDYNHISSNKLEKIEVKDKKLSDTEIVKYFNSNIEDLNIDLLEMKISKRITKLTLTSSYQKVMNFLMIISNNFKIEQFEIVDKENQLIVSISVNTSIFFISKNNYIINQELEDPFFIKSLEKNKTLQPIIVSAILDLEILVNNKWYKEGDRISHYQVVKIQKDKVLFKDTVHNKNVMKSVRYE
jgi:hypothetical protein